MKKNTIRTTSSGLFNAAIAQHFKKAARIIVNTDPENRTFSATDGYIVIRSGLADYDEILRPVLQRDPAPGSYSCFDKKWDRTGDGPTRTPDTFLDPGLKVTEARPAPFTLTLDEKTAVRPYYDGANVIYYNAAYISLFPAAETCLYSSGRYDLAVLGSDCKYYAGLLPIRVSNPDADRAVRAYFESAPADVEKLQREKSAAHDLAVKLTKELAAEKAAAGVIQNDRNAINQKYLTADKRVKELETQLEKIMEERDTYAAQLADIAKAAAEERAEEAKPADEKPALNTAGLEKLEGVTVVIKGAATNKPVAWITGETKKHAETLKKAGCKWSVKKSAWYLTA